LFTEDLAASYGVGYVAYADLAGEKLAYVIQGFIEFFVSLCMSGVALVKGLIQYSSLGLGCWFCFRQRWLCRNDGHWLVSWLWCLG